MIIPVFKALCCHRLDENLAWIRDKNETITRCHEGGGSTTSMASVTTNLGRIVSSKEACL